MADLVAYNSTLKEGIVNNGRAICVRMTEFHGMVVIVDGVVDTAHHTLIITKEEDRQRRNAIDCNQQATLLQLVGDIHAPHTIHGEVCPMGLVILWGEMRELVVLVALQGIKKEYGSRNERTARSPVGSFRR